MRMKRIFAIFMAIVLLLPGCLGFLDSTIYAAGSESEVIAEDQKTERYYYEQLPKEAKSLYDAMYNMYKNGIFKTGTDDYDLVANGHVTQEQLNGYANGNMTLLQHMGAARDAFYADYPDIFYVDFSYLSLRVTQNSDSYCAYIGSGRSDNYFLKGFKSKEDVEAAIKEYEIKINSIVDGAKNIKIEDGEDLIEQQIKYVHDEIISHTSYRMEDTCKRGNSGHIRTSYGVLITGEGLCEGYSRAVKAIMDRLGIPCILVQGGFQNTTDRLEPHMWNYVQLDKEWYAIDAAGDDPSSTMPSENGIDGYEQSDYLLAGDDIMSKKHIPDGIMSDANFEFSYPDIAQQSKLFDTVADTNGLKVLYSSDGTDGEIDTGIFRVSYNGMGAEKTIKSGKYILIRETKYYETTNRWEYGNWAYILPDVYMIYDTDTELILEIANAQYVEFAVTSEPPGNYNGNEGGSLENLSFHGDPLLFDASTEIIYNPSGTFISPPYAKTASPSSRLLIGRTYHINITYDDVLRLADDTKEPGIDVNVRDKNTSAIENCKIENFKWDGKDSVEFDFTPSKMWLDDSVIYDFVTTGLVGIESEKEPHYVSFIACYQRAICSYKTSGYKLNLFGRPTLLENADLSAKKDWKIEDGSEVTPEMVSRITLVATSPTHSQTDKMNNMIENEYPEQKVLKSETYNISLLLCNKNIISVGDSVRLSVGFPVGYGPDDEGVTFKAYHFNKDKYGDIISVEEIPCVITRYGLVITCKSFSPFAIIALQDDGTGVKTDKSVVLMNSQGGKFSGMDDNILVLSEGERKTLTIQPEEGYVIDEVVVGGKYQKIADSSSMKVEIDYNQVKDGEIIEAKFVTQTVREKELKRGETVVSPVPVPAKVEFESEEIKAGLNEKIEIVPRITKSEGVHSYQWYKDGVLLEGKTGDTLKIESAAVQDSGKYSLVVTTSAGAANVDSVSAECSVLVTEGSSSHDPQKPAVVTGLKAVSNSSDRVKLSWKKVSGADGYQVLYYNVSKKKFVKAVNVTKTSYTDKNKTSGESYRYKVRAYKKINGKTLYGNSSKEARIIVKPIAPEDIAGKRISNTAVKFIFKSVRSNANYQIYKYNKSSKKYSLAYKIKSAKLYKYNEKNKKWTYLNKVNITKDGRYIFNITGLKKNDTNQKYRIKTEVTKKGWPSGISSASETVTIK